MHAQLASKQQIRAQALHALRALDPAIRRQASARIAERFLALPEIALAETFFVYLSLPEEVDTRPIIDDLVAAGKAVYAPRFGRERHMQPARFSGWNELKRGALGIV